MADTREDRIRHRAHALWIAAGQPDGAHEDHWHRAETEIDAEDMPVAPKPARKPRAAAAPKPAKAAAKPRAKKA